MLQKMKSESENSQTMRNCTKMYLITLQLVRRNFYLDLFETRSSFHTDKPHTLDNGYQRVFSSTVVTSDHFLLRSMVFRLESFK